MSADWLVATGFLVQEQDGGSITTSTEVPHRSTNPGRLGSGSLRGPVMVETASTGPNRARNNQMYRLAELSDSTRKTSGGDCSWAPYGLVVAVIWIHFTSLPPERGRRGHLQLDTEQPLAKGVGYLVVFAASQMMVVGALFLWVLNQRMTWSRALFAAFVTWLELVIIFGMVPSEWLNFAQTDLDWSSQRVAVIIPPILVLGNTVEISYACSRTRSRWAITS